MYLFYISKIHMSDDSKPLTDIHICLGVVVLVLCLVKVVSLSRENGETTTRGRVWDLGPLVTSRTKVISKRKRS